MKRWRRFWRIAPAYLRSVARREWQLAVLALGGLAPGVAALTAWLHLAQQVQARPYPDPLRGWLLPTPLLDLLGPPGVLVGAGLVTLLIGCLGLTQAYLASLDRRMHELALLLSLGLQRLELIALLLLETLATGLLGSAVGVLVGLGLSGLSWPSAQGYFQLVEGYGIAGNVLLVCLGVGLLAALLFMGLSAMILTVDIVGLTLRPVLPPSWFDVQQAWRTTWTGTAFAAILTLVTSLAILPLSSALVLTTLAVALSSLLSGGGWILTRLYPQLQSPIDTPLWTLAVQGLTRHPRTTAALSLALTAGSYSVGLAALSWLGAPTQFFTVWVTALVLITAASLVLTVAAVSALERRHEFGLLMALGARRTRVWRLILLEYGIVAMGAGSLGAFLALINWIWRQQWENSWLALAIILMDLLGALLSAWAGAAPVLWLVTRRSPGQAIRQEFSGQ
jgi:predicted lysophospholipase L1 biosynthesis ABC-type transport system permease subunit